MTDVTVKDILNNRDSFKCDLEYSKTGNPEWTRIFVKDSKGYSIGRLSFNHDRLAYIKAYKEKLYRSGCKNIVREESDDIFDRIYAFCSTKKGV